MLSCSSRPSLVRASSGSSNTSKASPCTSIEAAVFVPGLTMRELKSQLASAVVQYRDDNGQAVQENDESYKENKIALYKEKCVMKLFAILASAVGGCLLIFSMFNIENISKFGWSLLSVSLFKNKL